MTYTKTRWLDDKTKLNARNMNKIEQGIEDATKVVEDFENDIDEIREQLYKLNIKLNGLAKIADFEALAEIVADKQYKLIDEGEDQNIKTINGESILGQGNIHIEGGGGGSEPEQYLKRAEVDENVLTLYKKDDSKVIFEAEPITEYVEMSEASLDAMTDKGVYRINNASDAPENTSNKGLLKVTNLSDNAVCQEWFSDSNHAIRVITEEEQIEFTVNGEVVPQGTVPLQAGYLYELSGTLIGNIEIYGSEPEKPTKLILNGVMIRSEKASAINYKPELEKLVVELYGDSENFIIVDDKETIEETSSYGAVHSEHDCYILGTGYLSIKNNKGHGVKAGEINLKGIPHLYIDAAHDGLHSSNTFKMSEGNVYINYANDAIGFSETATKNVVDISGGKIHVYNCKQNAFDTKLAGSKNIYNCTIELDKLFTESHPAFAGNDFNIYDNVTIINHQETELPEIRDFKERFGEAKVLKYIAGQEPEELLPNDGVFSLSQTLNGATGNYLATGDLSNYRINITASKVDLILNNVYYKNNDLGDTNSFINYNPNGKRVEIRCNEDTINYMYKENGIIINSNKNLKFVGKGTLIASSPRGRVLSAVNGDLNFDGDGNYYILDSKQGMATRQVKPGPDYEEDPEGKKSYVAIYANNNFDYDVYTLTNLYNKGGVHEGRIKATPEYYGISIFEKIVWSVGEGLNEVGYVDELGLLEAEKDNINNACIYVKPNNFTNINSVIYSLPFDEASSDFPEINPPSSTWKVYDTVSIERALQNMKGTYDSIILGLEERIRALEERRPIEPTTEPELNDNGNLILHNVQISDLGDLNLEDKAELNNEGNLNLK